MSPASVDSLLWEAAYMVLGNQETTIGELANALAVARDMNLMELLGGIDPVSGRKTLLAFVRQAVTAAPAPREGDVRAQVGVQETEAIPFPDLACWLFRDLRAEKIAANIAPRPQRKRK